MKNLLAFLISPFICKGIEDSIRGGIENSIQGGIEDSLSGCVINLADTDDSWDYTCVELCEYYFTKGAHHCKRINRDLTTCVKDFHPNQCVLIIPPTIVPQSTTFLTTTSQPLIEESSSLVTSEGTSSEGTSSEGTLTTAAATSLTTIDATTIAGTTLNMIPAVTTVIKTTVLPSAIVDTKTTYFPPVATTTLVPTTSLQLIEQDVLDVVLCCHQRIRGYGNYDSFCVWQCEFVGYGACPLAKYGIDYLIACILSIYSGYCYDGWASQPHQTC